MKHTEENRSIVLLHNAIMVGILVICLIVFIFSIIPADATFVAYAQDAVIDNQIDNLNIAVTNTSSNEENNLGTQPNLNENVHYISNYKYFLQNPLHHVNDGADNIGGTCTTVAVQMLIGYHAYYSDKRIVPSKSTSGVQLLSDNFGKAETNPEFYQIPYADLGDETIGTLDGLYEELWSHTTWPEFPGLGQNLIALKNAANEYIATEAAEIKSNVSIDYDSFDVNQAKSDIDNNLPIILGMSSISADASSYHVVVAYGYATINDVDGFIVHYGHRANKVQIFVPTSYFSFQLRMSVAHLHTFVPIIDENGSSIIDNYYKIIKCTECHSAQVDELYDTNRDNNIITGLKYAPIKNVSIPSSYKGIGDGVFKGTDIET